MFHILSSLKPFLCISLCPTCKSSIIVPVNCFCTIEYCYRKIVDQTLNTAREPCYISNSICYLFFRKIFSKLSHLIKMSLLFPEFCFKFLKLTFYFTNKIEANRLKIETFFSFLIYNLDICKYIMNFKCSDKINCYY